MKIEEKVVRFLHENNLTLASAESCTGGLIAKKITDVSGSSDIFGYGLVTYANEAKHKILKVKNKTLKNHGAVSTFTASEMAKGLLKLSGADVVICTTGIAGPGGGTEEKPVGTVYLAVYSKYGTTKVYRLTLGEHGTREEIREAAANRALEEALHCAEIIVKERGKRP